jgi:hypothetical protein
MDMQGALRARLLANTEVAAMVSRRIEWLLRPQGQALPAITLTTVSDDRPDTMKGFAAMRSTRVQVDCWAQEYATARALAEAVIVAAALPAASNGIRFGRAGVEGPRDLTEETTPGTIARATLDLIVWHQHA